MMAFRFRPQVVDLLSKMAKKTLKTKTRLIEEAIQLHAGEVGK